MFIKLHVIKKTNAQAVWADGQEMIQKREAELTKVDR